MPWGARRRGDRSLVRVATDAMTTPELVSLVTADAMHAVAAVADGVAVGLRGVAYNTANIGLRVTPGTEAAVMTHLARIGYRVAIGATAALSAGLACWTTRWPPGTTPDLAVKALLEASWACRLGRTRRNTTGQVSTLAALVMGIAPKPEWLSAADDPGPAADKPLRGPASERPPRKGRRNRGEERDADPEVRAPSGVRRPAADFGPADDDGFRTKGGGRVGMAGAQPPDGPGPARGLGRGRGRGRGRDASAARGGPVVYNAWGCDVRARSPWREDGLHQGGPDRSWFYEGPENPAEGFGNYYHGAAASIERRRREDAWHNPNMSVVPGMSPARLDEAEQAWRAKGEAAGKGAWRYRPVEVDCDAGGPATDGDDDPVPVSAELVEDRVRAAAGLPGSRSTSRGGSREASAAPPGSTRPRWPGGQVGWPGRPWSAGPGRRTLPGPQRRGARGLRGQGGGPGRQGCGGLRLASPSRGQSGDRRPQGPTGYDAGHGAAARRCPAGRPGPDRRPAAPLAAVAPPVDSSTPLAASAPSLAAAAPSGSPPASSLAVPGPSTAAPAPAATDAPPDPPPAATDAPPDPPRGGPTAGPGG